MNKDLYLLDESVVNDTCIRALKVKDYLAVNPDATIQEAIAKFGISRSAYYKYRDKVFNYSKHNDAFDIEYAVEGDEPMAIILDFLDRLYNVEGISMVGFKAVSNTSKRMTFVITVKFEDSKLLEALTPFYFESKEDVKVYFVDFK